MNEERPMNRSAAANEGLGGVGDAIFADVQAAMQNAEEIGGPEGSDYPRLMRRIEAEARQRAETYEVNTAFAKAQRGELP